MTARVIIGGGSGFVGTRLKTLLSKNGYDTIVISRKQGPGKVTWSDIKRNGLPENCTAVINLSGENILNPMRRWNKSFQDAVRSSRIDTTKLLATAITESATPPKVFVTISGVAGYHPHRTKEYTELSQLEDFDFLSRLVIDWENAAKLPEDTKVRQAIVRSGVVLGREGGMIQQLYYPFYFMLGGPIGNGAQWLPWIHVDDLVGIFKHVLSDESVHGILNGVAPTPATNSDFTKAFASAINRPAFIPVPGFAMNFVYGSERAKVILDGQKVLPSRTLASGYTFKYPTVKSACQEVVS